MKVEILIYIYLTVCMAMICFNIVCAFVFIYRDRRIERYSKTFVEKIREQVERGEVDEAHKKYLSKMLRRIGNLMAFDQTVDQLVLQNPEGIARYLEALAPVFVSLTREYRKKNKMKAAYFPYIIQKHRIDYGQDARVITTAMLELVRDENLYCRENALQALYAIGDVGSVVEALNILDASENGHHPKLIVDGLLRFSGDREALWSAFWRQFPRYSTTMKVALLDYFRFCTGTQCVQMLRLLISPDSDDEIRFSCIRYFGKYHYEPAFPYLLDFAEARSGRQWEYAAIAATALANYPGPRTVEVLRELLYSKDWYVRYNASQSLERLGQAYTDLIEVFEDKDRYAGEMMRYRLDQKKMKNEAKPL